MKNSTRIWSGASAQVPRDSVRWISQLLFLKMCHAQSCGKCVPCRVGLGQLGKLMEDVLDGEASLETIDLIEKTAKNIFYSADCAIGYEAAKMVLKGIRGFRDDFEEHVLRGRCKLELNQPVPCVSQCPAGSGYPGIHRSGCGGPVSGRGAADPQGQPAAGRLWADLRASLRGAVPQDV